MTYLDYLGEVLVRLLVPLLGRMVRFGSLEKAMVSDSLANVFGKLVFVKHIVPRCDLDSCLHLSHYPFTPAEDVEAFDSLFRFDELTKVSFPFSPYLCQYLCSFDVGNEEQRNEFLQELKLDRMGEREVNQYLFDCLVLGFGVPEAKYDLFASMVMMKFPTALSSLADFHQFLVHSTGWMKEVRDFCKESFDPIAIVNFTNLPNPTNTDLVDLSSVQGVVSLRRLDLLSKITEEDPEVSWELLRAAGVIISSPHLLKKESAEELAETYHQLSLLLHTFKTEGMVKGLLYLISSTPSHFIKYFLFEIFRVQKPGEENDEIIFKVISQLGEVDKEEAMDQEQEENYKCGYALLLRQGIRKQLLGPTPQGVESLLHFSQSSFRNFSLFVHCMFVVISQDSEEILPLVIAGRREEGGSFGWGEMVRAVSAQVALFGIFDYEGEKIEEEDEEDLKVLSGQVEALVDDPRSAALFIVRHWSQGGAVDVERAISRTKKGCHYPKKVRDDEVLIDLGREIQGGRSPLAFLPEFARVNIMLDQEGQQEEKKQEQQQQIKAATMATRIASLGCLLLGISPTPLPNNPPIPPLLPVYLPPDVTNSLGRLSSLVSSFPNAHMKELFLHFSLRDLTNSTPFLFATQMAGQQLRERAAVANFRKEVEECLVPRCPNPNCRNSFYDFNGCFAVKCNRCGTSFCARCLNWFGRDAHPHVAQVHGQSNMFGPDASWKRGFGAIAIPKIRNVLRGVPAELLDLLSSEVASLLEGNGFFIRPEQVLERRVGGVRAPPISPLVGMVVDLMIQFGFGQLVVKGEVQADKEEEVKVKNLVKKIEELLKRIHGHSFSGQPDQTGAYLWVHAVFRELTEGRKGAEGEGGWDRKKLEGRLGEILAEFGDVNMLLGRFDKACQGDRDGIILINFVYMHIFFSAL